MKYENYRYIYPPRPKNTISSDNLFSWDNGMLLAQPKLNGSNVTIYTNSTKFIVMNRHGQRMTNFKISNNDLLTLSLGQKGKWLAINGEYMNKGKTNEFNQNFNDKFVIFDILVYESEYLIGSTFQDRIMLLDNLYDFNDYNSYLDQISEHIFKVKSFDKGFYSHYNQLTSIDMIEGLVLKRKNAKLEIGNSENNNTKSQIKCRKPTKNYKY